MPYQIEGAIKVDAAVMKVVEIGGSRVLLAGFPDSRRIRVLHDWDQASFNSQNNTKHESLPFEAAGELEFS